MGGGPRPWTAVKMVVVAVEGNTVTLSSDEPATAKVGDECMVVFPASGHSGSGAPQEPSDS